MHHCGGPQGLDELDQPKPSRGRGRKGAGAQKVVTRPTVPFFPQHAIAPQPPRNAHPSALQAGRG